MEIKKTTDKKTDTSTKLNGPWVKIEFNGSWLKWVVVLCALFCKEPDLIDSIIDLISRISI